MASPDHAATVLDAALKVGQRTVAAPGVYGYRADYFVPAFHALDALVAALAQAEHERDEARKHANKLGRELDEQGDELERAERQRDRAIEALRTIHTSPICFIDCTERVGAVLATLDPDAAT